ncbi:hypothetical protein Gogos_007221 [Gossypium gossypioides]|uniref:Uncharacterized protein n=1 Tax=Gossypium gossypioides TaxID=34282 RepID=A0A7J9C849_GOSGO|nr:hypothetical protein [Gossypium gossypioides]
MGNSRRLSEKPRKSNFIVPTNTSEPQLSETGTQFSSEVGEESRGTHHFYVGF